MSIEAARLIEFHLKRDDLDPRERRKLEAALVELQDTPQDILNQTLDAFKSTSTNPEVVTQSSFQIMWQLRQQALHEQGIDLDLTVEDCPYTPEQLTQLEQEGRRVGYLPESLSTQEQRRLFAKLWPQMKSHSTQEGNTVTNEVARHGWFDYDVSIKAPHTNTTEDELDALFESQDRLGMNLTEYIIASQDSKLLTGCYLDEMSTFVRLLGSRSYGNVVSVRFRSNGALYVYSHPRSSSGHGVRLGGRSVGVPPKA